VRWSYIKRFVATYFNTYFEKKYRSRGKKHLEFKLDVNFPHDVRPPAESLISNEFQPLDFEIK